MTALLAPLLWTLLCAVGVGYALRRLLAARVEDRLARRLGGSALRLALTGADLRAARASVLFLAIYFGVGLLALALVRYHETKYLDWVGAGITLGLLAGLLLYVVDLDLRSRADERARWLARRGGGEG